MRPYRTLLHSLDNHGIAGTLRRVFAQISKRTRPAAKAPVTRRDQAHPFDLQHQTETGGWIPGEQLTSGSKSDLYNTAYYGISPSTLQQALALTPHHPESTFVDLGCGKGRALLVASTLPFAQLLGVELSPDLCTIARANLDRLGITGATILQQDATTLTYPAGPLLIFLYHPFLAPILRRVLVNLLNQRVASPHPTLLLYANPQYPRVFARYPTLKPVWNHIFQLSPEDAAADRHGTTNERYALFTLNPPQR